MNERDTLNTTIGLPFAKGSIQLSFNQDSDLQLQWLKFLTFSFSVGCLSYANLAWGKLRYYHLEQLHPGNHWLLINVVAYVAYIFLKVHLCELHVNLHNFVSSIDNFLWVLEVKVPQALSKYCDESVIPNWTLFCTG